MNKIQIRATANADTRTTKEPVSKEALRKDTEIHIADVKNGMIEFANELIKRAESHDHTKLDYFKEFHEDFIAEQTKERVFKEGGWWQKHLEERHHLKDRIPADVTIFDIIEQIVDCNAAGIGRSGEVYPMDLPDEVLQQAYKNTVSYINSHMYRVNEVE